MEWLIIWAIMSFSLAANGIQWFEIVKLRRQVLCADHHWYNAYMLLQTKVSGLRSKLSRIGALVDIKI